ncbi:MAG: DUF512 domain-containing protein [Lachnospiraceae bacterium]|nr:DUF512 domain-containing protein [Lachnospiraceae bacterium]
MERKTDKGKKENRKKDNGHVIASVQPWSIGEELELVPGDIVVSINGKKIEDIFDYRFLQNDEYLVLGVISHETGELWEFEIEKDYDEDLGLEFESGMMDDYRSCHNKCIFCFIDQLPKGMRETLYFKDDDARLSFLQGNYVTLTNMSDKDVERICYYKLSPINVSIHTTNPELRCKMLHNRFAGDALRHIKTFCDAGLEINGQVVLCKGYNDGEELERTMSDIEQYLPSFKSMSIVPVGLTKFREGLCELSPFTPDDAKAVLDQIERKQKYFLEKYGTRIVYASDEWYLRAGRPIPPIEEYEGFPQIENGVGMLRSMIDEVEDEIAYIKEEMEDQENGDSYDNDPNRFLTDTVFHVVTGYAAYSTINMLAGRLQEEFGLKHIHVHKIINDFFGHDIDVTGLLTGQDILRQLREIFKNENEDENALDSMILLPCSTLKSGEDIFLDDMTLENFENALQKKVRIVKSSGSAFVGSFMKDYERDYYSNELNKYEIS